MNGRCPQARTAHHHPSPLTKFEQKRRTTGLAAANDSTVVGGLPRYIEASHERETQLRQENEALRAEAASRAWADSLHEAEKEDGPPGLGPGNSEV